MPKILTQKARREANLTAGMDLHCTPRLASPQSYGGEQRDDEATTSRELLRGGERGCVEWKEWENGGAGVGEDDGV